VTSATINNRHAEIDTDVSSKTVMVLAFGSLPSNTKKTNPPRDNDQWQLRLFVGSQEKLQIPLAVVGCGA